jgi:hypothetical protein
VNQILVDMLRVCLIDHQGSWDQCFPVAEFSYNTSYQESIKMTPFEVLYGRRYRTLLNWIEPVRRQSLGLTSLPGPRRE